MNSSMSPNKGQQSFWQSLWLRIEGGTHRLVHLFHLIGGVAFVVAAVASGIAFFKTDLGKDIYNHVLDFLKNDAAITALLVLFLTSVIGNAIYCFYTYRANDSLDRYQKNENNFLCWSQENAACDRFLFEKLFKEVSKRNVTDQAVAVASSRIEQNISDTVQYASDILSRFTGFRCSAALEILRVDDRGRLYLLSRNEWRDKNSQIDHRELEKTYLSDESARREVMAGEKYFSDDDLKSNSDYENKTFRWQNEFNAMIVCGVEQLIERETKDHDYYYGALIITNKEGGLANGTAKNYATELSQRLEVMAYRLESLRNLKRVGS